MLRDNKLRRLNPDPCNVEALVTQIVVILNTWFHTCESIIKTHLYETMHNSNKPWNCLKCGIPNSSSTLFIMTTLNVLKTYISTSHIQMTIPFNFRENQLG